jgi:transcriptional regulator with XRE-family HTH domain
LINGAEDLLAHPLTAVRQQRGWTLADVAAVVAGGSGLNMASHRQKVWRWEHGLAVPERPAQLALADELRIAHDMVDVHPWPRWLLLTGPAESPNEPWTWQSAVTTMERVVESALMDRRGFLIMSGTAATALALQWSVAAPAELTAVERGRVTPEAINHIDERVEELWRLDDLLGGGACLGAATADLRLVQRLIQHGRYDAAVGGRLWSVAAALARFCGFAAFDAGRQAAAQRFWHAGLRAAAVAGDATQGVYVLSNLALQAAYAGDGTAAVGLIDIARRRVDPAECTVLAMLDCWSARGLAVAGNAKASAARLNLADDLYERRRPGNDPEWVYWMPQPSLTAEAGTALLEAGDLAAAERMLTAGLETLDAGSARDRNLYLVRLAETRLRSGRLDEAAATARDAIDAAVGVDSIRVRERVDGLLHQFRPNEPLTAELREYEQAAR